MVWFLISFFIFRICAHCFASIAASSGMGLPITTVLWRGFTQLADLDEGFRAAKTG